METLIMHPQNKEQLNALKAIAKTWKIIIETKKEDDLSEREKAINLYGIEMVEVVERAEKDIKNGNTTRVKKEDLKSFLGL